MGYLKRKRTKRRGKKGTKKYRGGMSSNAEPVESTPGTAGAVANAGADQKLETKKILDEKMTTLKSLYGEGPTTKAEIETIKGAMSEVSGALEAYNILLD